MPIGGSIVATRLRTHAIIVSFFATIAIRIATIFFIAKPIYLIPFDYVSVHTKVPKGINIISGEKIVYM
jgi:hypothetical protein